MAGSGPPEGDGRGTRTGGWHSKTLTYDSSTRDPAFWCYTHRSVSSAFWDAVRCALPKRVSGPASSNVPGRHLGVESSVQYRFDNIVPVQRSETLGLAAEQHDSAGLRDERRFIFSSDRSHLVGQLTETP